MCYVPSVTWVIIALYNFHFLVAVSNFCHFTIPLCSCSAIQLHKLIKDVTYSLPFLSSLSFECQICQVPFLYRKEILTLFLPKKRISFSFLLFLKLSHCSYVLSNGAEQWSPNSEIPNWDQNLMKV